MRTILLALTLGFFAVWALEFRRAGLLESYWLLLVSIVCLLIFQFVRLKASMSAGAKQQKEVAPTRQIATKKPKK
ncbi:hypothetical protein [Dyadobacter luticola]|nr:hypothetical protein [Dyadobacter luticola]